MKIRSTDICIILSKRRGNYWITYQGSFHDRDSDDFGSPYDQLTFMFASPGDFVIRVDAVNAEIWKAFK